MNETSTHSHHYVRGTCEWCGHHDPARDVLARLTEALNAYDGA